MATHRWIAGTGVWSNTGNWSDAQIPNATDDNVTIDAAGSYVVTVESGQA